jgi:hypothetical protein
MEVGPWKLDRELISLKKALFHGPTLVLVDDYKKSAKKENKPTCTLSPLPPLLLSSTCFYYYNICVY